MPISNHIKDSRLSSTIWKITTRKCVPNVSLDHVLLQNHLTFRIFVSPLYLCGISMFKDIQIDSCFKIILMTSHLCQLNIV